MAYLGPTSGRRMLPHQSASWPSPVKATGRNGTSTLAGEVMAHLARSLGLPPGNGASARRGASSARPACLNSTCASRMTASPALASPAAEDRHRLPGRDRLLRLPHPTPSCSRWYVAGEGLPASVTSLSGQAWPPDGLTAGGTFLTATAPLAVRASSTMPVSSTWCCGAHLCHGARATTASRSGAPHPALKRR